MGHFIIDLPENKKGDVRWGMVKKIKFSFFRKNKSETKKGYLVNLPDSDSKAVCRLFRSPNGVWFKDPEGKEELNDRNLDLIKNAIIEKEKELNIH